MAAAIIEKLHTTAPPYLVVGKGDNVKGVQSQRRRILPPLLSGHTWSLRPAITHRLA